jgi:hypothetical protein
MFAPDVLAVSPILTSIDGGSNHVILCPGLEHPGVIGTTVQNFNTNRESGFDFQYGMSLVTKKQAMTLTKLAIWWKARPDPQNGSTNPQLLPGAYFSML